MKNGIFDEIGDTLKNNFPRVFKSLQNPAKNDDFQELNIRCFAGRGIPEEIRSLFSWHNGQKGNLSFNQEDSFSFLPISEVIDSYEFLNDPNEDILQPYSSSWIPLFYNGAGDYLVYVSDAEDKGKIISYWHDDPERSIKYLSIEELLKDALRAAQGSDEKERENWAWEKVNVVLEHVPPGGIKAIKLIKDTINPELGIGQIMREVGNGPMTLIKDTYYTVARDQVNKLHMSLGCECLSIYRANQGKEKMPT